MISESDFLPRRVRESVTGTQRCKVLEDLEILDTPADPELDRLTRLAAGLFGSPVSVLTLVDRGREWHKSRFGVDQTESPLCFGAHTIAGPGSHLLVLDADADDRFPPTLRGPVRFFAGAPVVVRGERVGALCVCNSEPMPAVAPPLIGQLTDLAGVAASLFQLKHEARGRARTADELIKEEWRHALTLEAGKVGSYVWDITTGEVVANDIMRRMYGFDAIKRLSIEEFFDVIDPDHVPAVNAAIETTFEDGVDYVAEFRVRSGRWLSARGRVYQRDGSGRPLVMMGVNIDITEARQAADHTRYLLRELNHRVKNTLAMTQSLARQTLRQSPDPHDFIEAFSGRLRTLADAHTLLADRDWAGIGLIELVDTQVGPYMLSAEGRLTVLGEDVLLPPDHALGLGIILHELASNAARFGALSGAAGSVRIAWRVSNGEVQIEWIERGGPALVGTPEAGFGSRLIRRSLDKIMGSSVSLEFAPEGVEARISFPLT